MVAKSKKNSNAADTKHIVCAFVDDFVDFVDSWIPSRHDGRFSRHKDKRLKLWNQRVRFFNQRRYEIRRAERDVGHGCSD
jgi:hypothetical protein